MPITDAMTFPAAYSPGEGLPIDVEHLGIYIGLRAALGTERAAVNLDR